MRHQIVQKPDFSAIRVAFDQPGEQVVAESSAMLARDTTGRPVLWVERSVHPIIGPPTSHLRFDVMAEDARPASGGADG